MGSTASALALATQCEVAPGAHGHCLGHSQSNRFPDVLDIHFYRLVVSGIGRALGRGLERTVPLLRSPPPPPLPVAMHMPAAPSQAAVLGCWMELSNGRVKGV